MNTSNAFTLAGKIGFHYDRKSSNSKAINTEIAQFLGPSLYGKFCKEITSMPDKKKYFSINFLKNPVDEKDCIDDLEIHENYSFDSLMQTLAKITSN